MNPEPNETNNDGNYRGHVSEYAYSDNYDSPDLDDKNGRKKKSMVPVFDPKINMYKMEPLLGMKFNNRG